MTLAAPNASQNARPNHNASRTLLYQTLGLPTLHGMGNAWAEATNTMSAYHLYTPQVERDTTVGKAVNISMHIVTTGTMAIMRVMNISMLEERSCKRLVSCT